MLKIQNSLYTTTPLTIHILLVIKIFLLQPTYIIHISLELSHNCVHDIYLTLEK
jgi:hypothetical protein